MPVADLLVSIIHLSSLFVYIYIYPIMKLSSEKIVQYLVTRYICKMNRFFLGMRCTAAMDLLAYVITFYHGKETKETQFSVLTKMYK